MKKTKILKLTLSLLFALMAITLLGVYTQEMSTYALEDSYEIGQVPFNSFADREIEDIGYIYNYDDSVDYIYIDFSGPNGYAIFAEETLEILEYTTMGDFPYANTNGKKYYGGPGAYFNKCGTQFIDIITNESFVISNNDAEAYAQINRQTFSIKEKTINEREILNEKQGEKIQTLLSRFSNNLSNSWLKEPSNPPLDGNNWISPTAGATYIENSDYFLTNWQAPMHGENTKGSCTTVATQLMLSYNNFYNDRRIIAPEHLYGDWNPNGNGDIFDPANYANPEWNPNVSSDPRSMTSHTLGANQAHHDLLFDNGITGYLSDSQKNLKSYLNTKGLDFEIQSQTATTLAFGWGNAKTIDSKNILAEIDAGRPIVISTAENLNGTPYPGQNAFNHSVIAYGYQAFKAYAENGNTNTYLGYIVHMGWDSHGFGNNINVWTNSSWYYSYLSLKINHTHNYNITTTNNVGGAYREIRCGECGHRTVDTLFLTDTTGTVITGAKYALPQEIVVPKAINGKTILGINDSVFQNNANIRSVTFDFDSEIQFIGKNAFCECVNLRYAILPDTLIKIGDSAFKNCTSLEDVFFSYNLKEIGAEAFFRCEKLQNLYLLPDSLSSIGNGAFAYCRSLQRFWIPSNVTTINDYTFCFCSSLERVTLSGDVKRIGNCAFLGTGITTIDIPDTVSRIGESAFAECAKLLYITIPNSVTYIGNKVFSGCNNLTNVTLSSGIANIPESAFSGCTKLKDITLSDEITEIGKEAFAYCSSLTSMSMPCDLKAIGDGAFKGCTGLKVFSMNTLDYQRIGKEAFAYCTSLEKISLHYGLESIGEGAFRGCSRLTTINLPTTLTKIEDYLFYECSALSDIEIKYQITSIGNYAFYGAGLTEIIIPVRVLSIGSQAFANCYYLTSVDFFDYCELETIEEGAFSNCINLKQIQIPSTITYVGSSAFQKWTEYQTIYIETSIETLTSWNLNCFECHANIYWSCYGEGFNFNLIDDDTAYEISVGAMFDCVDIVIIPNLYEGLPVTRIADYGFAECDIITKVFMPRNGNLTTIGEYAFINCRNLQNIKIPEGVEYIGSYAFADCTSLENINLPSSIKNLFEHVFADCPNLKTITIPDAVIYIDQHTFETAHGYTIYAEATTISSEWEYIIDTIQCNIIFGCTLSQNKTYVVSIEYRVENVYNFYSLNPPYREGYIFEGWATEDGYLYSYVEYSMEDLCNGNVPDGTVLYAMWIPE